MLTYVGVAVGLAGVIFLVLKVFVWSGPKLPPPPPPSSGPNRKKSEDDASGGLPMTILYGSQSGTAESFSNQLAKEAKRYGFKAKVYDLEDYDHEEKLSQEQFVVFLMATFGEGEPTDNAVNFYEWIKSEDRDAGCVDGVPYAVFALGNRQYEFFCSVGRLVSKRMKDLGADEIVEHGEGDDDGSLEDDYAAWKEKFWEAAKERFGVVGDAGQDSKFEPQFTLEFVEGKEAEHTLEESKVHIDPKHGGDYALCIENRELRQDTSDKGSTRHIELDLSGLPLKYRTADNLGVLPRNEHKLAAHLAKRLEVNMKAVFTLKPKVAGAKNKLGIPSPCTVADAFLWYCDITSCPKRGLLELIGSYCTEPDDKAKVKSWTVGEAKQEYADHMMSLVEVLEALPSAKVPLGDLLEFVPKLQPRFYTISSSSKKHPEHVHITVSVTRADKPGGRVHEGVCSNYLAKLRPGKDRVAVFIRRSGFTPAWEIHGDKPGVHPPMIMIGPGTGLAPFRAFLQEARHLYADHKKELGPLYLYFGCRRSDADFIYKDEIEEAKADVLNQVHLAFSREEGEKKVYVQDKLRDNAEQVWKLVDEQKAYVYVCGGTSMGRDVRNTLLELAQKYGKKTEAEAQQMLKNMQSNGRYVQELWS